MEASSNQNDGIEYPTSDAQENRQTKGKKGRIEVMQMSGTRVEGPAIETSR